MFIFVLYVYMCINEMEKLDPNEDTERDLEYFNRLLRKYVCKKRETVEKKKHVLKTIDKYNGNKKQEIMLARILLY